MLFLRLRLLGLLTLAGGALGAGDIAALITQTPECVKNCAFPALTNGQCANQDLVTCLCTNNTVQYDLGACVIKSCSVQEQWASTAIFQDSLCTEFTPPSRWSEVARSTIILCAITFPIIILRFISRWTIAHRFWWDDWCILISVAFLIPLTVLPFIDANKGIGLHFWNVRPEHVSRLRKIVWVNQILYICVMGLSKASLLFLYLRIFTHKPFHKLVKCLLIFTTTQCTLFMFLILFHCSPVSSIWSLTPTKCLDLRKMGYAGAALTIFEDFAILLLPIHELYKLSLSPRKKFALCFMFALGSFASITSIVRLTYVTKYINSIDATWDNVDVFIWSNIEIFASVICASIVAVRPLIVKIIPSSIWPTTIKETLPTPPPPPLGSNSNSRRSSRWSTGINKFLLEAGRGSHWKLRDEKSADSGETAVQKESSVKVWVTNDTSVESDNNMELDELNRNQKSYIV